MNFRPYQELFFQKKSQIKMIISSLHRKQSNMIKRNSEYIDDEIGILLDLVHFKNNIDTLRNMLSQIGFDSETELVYMSRDDMVEILQRSLDKKISFLELEEWANLIECREDIGFEDKKTQEMVFKLANPYLYGKLDEKQVLSYLNELDEKCGDKYKIVDVFR